MPRFTFFVKHTIEADTEEKARMELQQHLDECIILLAHEKEFFCRVDDPAPKYGEGTQVVVDGESHEWQGRIERHKGFENGSHVYTVIDQDDEAFDIDEEQIVNVISS